MWVFALFICIIFIKYLCIYLFNYVVSSRSVYLYYFHVLPLSSDNVTIKDTATQFVYQFLLQYPRWFIDIIILWLDLDYSELNLELETSKIWWKRTKKNSIFFVECEVGMKQVLKLFLIFNSNFSVSCKEDEKSKVIQEIDNLRDNLLKHRFIFKAIQLIMRLFSLKEWP